MLVLDFGVFGLCLRFCDCCCEFSCYAACLGWFGPVTLNGCCFSYAFGLFRSFIYLWVCLLDLFGVFAWVASIVGFEAPWFGGGFVELISTVCCGFGLPIV